MSEFQLMAIAVVAAVIGGAIAARLAKIEVWKGVLVGGCAAVAAVLASFAPGVDRSLSMPMAGLIAAGISGSAVGLTPARTANIAIGAALPPLLGFVLMEMGL
ncbi:hypothetical protein QTA58_15000 [Neorhizobium sp. CSC1952]|uniref:Uncharacterized protein n=1 Tax=Xaviernesmea oryzae TaxID=464029 RepID=A0A1X7CZZ9_9HYPH|nr:MULTISPECIES: hypothetical protein [Rhizobium/Agrobacterium group]WJR65541.1 hypothetical protein QTA58_15000 [Rhizobium sp. CSC1952]SMF06166.1 hypothetical protein SAMN02982989_4823 [Xaviernesmea oryzae]